MSAEQMELARLKAELARVKKKFIFTTAYRKRPAVPPVLTGIE